jgi:hydrogenase nickel incorporation protein HypA/HybF
VGALDWPEPSPKPAVREGFAAVETPRGRLCHWTRLSRDGIIDEYAIVAPTEWNLHPAGPFVLGALGARARRRRSPGSPGCSTPACRIASKCWSRPMHEMALTQSLVELIEDEGRKQGFSRVRVVRLEIGALGSVEPEAMRFCFDAAARGAIVEGARLDIDIVPGEGWCLDCAKSVPMFERFGPCPECGRHHVQVDAGDDMRVKELEVE